MTSAAHSWRRPGGWRLAYAIPWLILAIAFGVVIVVSPVTWFGGATPGTILATAALVVVPALIPAAGFVLARGRVGLILSATLGLLIVFLLFLAVAGIRPPMVWFWILTSGLMAAILDSVIAIVVLLITSHETPPPSNPGPDLSFPNLPLS